MKPKLALVTTCMGRLEHVQQSSRVLLQDPRVGTEVLWLLVDFACPQKTGDWVEKTYPGRVEVLRIDPPEPLPGEPPVPLVFNKPLALNSGAVAAVQRGAEYLAFLDADTLVTPAFLDAVLGAMSLDSFLMFSPEPASRDLTGFLCVNQRQFLRAGGYDPEFLGWGAEDLEIRMKLFLKLGLRCSELPPSLASSIPHDDAARVAHYDQKDKDASHNRNLNLLCANAFKWTGKHLLDLYAEDSGMQIRRLLGIEAINPKELL